MINKIDKTKVTAKRFLELRNKLGLTQQEASQVFGVHLTTWQGWEYGVTLPSGPGLILLEHYETTPPQKPDIAQRCKIVRQCLGLKKGEMAKMFEVQPNTWGYWERGVMKPSNEFIEKIEQMYKEVAEKESLQKAS